MAARLRARADPADAWGYPDCGSHSHLHSVTHTKPDPLAYSKSDAVTNAQPNTNAESHSQSESVAELMA